MWTPQSDGKRERLCFIEHKDNSFVSSHNDFTREVTLFFRPHARRNKNTGTFSRSAPCFSHRSPSFSGRLPAMGGKSVAAFSLHSAFVPFPAPQLSVPSRMTPSHAGTRTHALRTQQVSTFLPSPITRNLLRYCSLGVKIFAFPLSAPEGEGSSPKPSPSKCCCSTICAHRVKR